MRIKNGILKVKAMKPLRHINVKIELEKDDSTEAISALVSLVREEWKQLDIAIQVSLIIR